MFVAFCDHVFGNSTSSCSNTEPIARVAQLPLDGRRTDARPAWVNRRRTLSASPARVSVLSAVCGVCCSMESFPSLRWPSARSAKFAGPVSLALAPDGLVGGGPGPASARKFVLLLYRAGARPADSASLPPDAEPVGEIAPRAGGAEARLAPGVAPPGEAAVARRRSPSRRATARPSRAAASSSAGRSRLLSPSGRVTRAGRPAAPARASPAPAVGAGCTGVTSPSTGGVGVDSSPAAAPSGAAVVVVAAAAEVRQVAVVGRRRRRSARAAASRSAAASASASASASATTQSLLVPVLDRRLDGLAEVRDVDVLLLGDRLLSVRFSACRECLQASIRPSSR